MSITNGIYFSIENHAVSAERLCLFLLRGGSTTMAVAPHKKSGGSNRVERGSAYCESIKSSGAATVVVITFAVRRWTSTIVTQLQGSIECGLRLARSMINVTFCALTATTRSMSR